MSSTMSLDSLSSPSPSPSPGPETAQAAHETTRAGLDSDSELSELTEEEQEAENTTQDHDDDEDEKPRRTARRDTVTQQRSDWGKQRKIDEKSANVVEEEEEEELSGPPKAMEEEEEEEDDEDYDAASRPLSVVNENDFDEDEDEDASRGDEDGDGDPPADAVDEDESVSGDVDPIVRNRRSARGRRASGYQNGEDEYPLSSRKTNTFDSDDDEDDLSEPPAGQQDDGAESDNDETNSEDGGVEDAVQNSKSPSVPIAATSRALKTTPSTTLADINVDLTAPSPKSMAAVAASSIMAGSSVLVPPSPSASSASSEMSSRSPTPTFEASGKVTKIYDGEGGVSSRRNSLKRPNISDKHAEVSSSVNDKNNSKAAASADPDVPEQDGSLGEIEVDEPSPDQDVEMELESDLQPAHRAEALDVLATIELKFALLRERVYVEKMECLAWEEAMVSEDTHPELIHLLAELTKRRDKRLGLAARKRAHEISNVTKKRILEESATWNWWKVARDELQTDLVAETNRKRRCLERERRATERPQPVRRLPKPPQDVSIPPTLRQIAKSFPLATSKQHSVHKRRGRKQPSADTVYPALSELSSADIATDLNYLLQHRRTSLDGHRTGNMNVNGINTHIGQPPHVYDQYGAATGVENTGLPFGGSGPGSRMLPPPTPSFANQHQLIPFTTSQPPVSGFPSFGPGTGRHNHYPHPPSSSAVNLQNHNHQPQYPLEHDLPPVVSNPGPGSGHVPFSQHSSYFGQAPASIAPGQLGHAYPNTGGHFGQRRSISPVQVIPNGLGSGKNSGGWLGVMHKQSGSNEWMGDGRRHDMSMNDGEEEDRDNTRMREIRRGKERIRERSERDRERDQHEYEREHERERSHHIQQHQHRSHPGGPPHQHIHGPAGPVPHIPAPHHHHHHHHHVVHHHHSSSSGHASSAPPPPGHVSALSPRIVTSRDFEIGRSQSGPSRPTEIINLSTQPTMSSSWKGDDFPPPPDPRKHVRRPSSGPPILDERERTLAMPFVMNAHGISREANGSTVSPPRGSWNNTDDASYRIPPPSSSAPSSYHGSTDNHGHSPGHRYSSSAGHLGRGPPPPLARQNSIGLSPPRPRPFPPSPSSSSAYIGPSRSPNRYGPSLHGQGLSPPHSHSTTMSTSPNMKTRRPSSPVLGAKLALSPGSGFSPRPTGPVRTTSPANLGPTADLKSSGSVSSSTPSYGIGNRTTSPLMTYLSPVQHPSQSPTRPIMNSNGAVHPDRHSPHLPPMPPPQKMTMAQIVDGR